LQISGFSIQLVFNNDKNDFVCVKDEKDNVICEQEDFQSNKNFSSQSENSEIILGKVMEYFIKSY
jgi:hypothetical protein